MQQHNLHGDPHTYACLMQNLQQQLNPFACVSTELEGSLAECMHCGICPHRNLRELIVRHSGLLVSSSLSECLLLRSCMYVLAGITDSYLQQPHYTSRHLLSQRPYLSLAKPSQWQLCSHWLLSVSNHV